MTGSANVPNFLHTVYTDSEYRVGKHQGAFADPNFYVIKNLGFVEDAGPIEAVADKFDSLEEARIYIANQYSENHK